MDFSFEPKLKKVLNKAYLKKPVARNDLATFRDHLLAFVERLDPQESEEHLKNLLADFLKTSFYGKDYQVNTWDRIDLTIAKGGRPQVLFETKRPGNANEMMTTAQPNAKALHQILYYFLEERVTGKNLEIKTLVVTDIDHWFVFDARDFETLATKDKQLVKDYESFKAGGLLFNQTGDFYSQVAKPWFEAKAGHLAATVIDLKELVRAVTHRPDDLEALVPLYKLLSPAHLLKEPFQNDSNTLDKNFYGELLYWMGLEEAKEGSKAVIRRPSHPQPASLVELIVERLELDDRLPPGQAPWDVAMELALLWVNRLLFLKLLESQLATYHRGDAAYRFMAVGDLKDFDDLYSLFFGVLAVRTGERHPKYAQRWAKVPYLNSSLFEQSETEKRILSIDRLDNHAALPVWGRSVLKAPDGKRAEGARTTLDYLLSFLDAFDFSSEGTGEVQDSGKTLINASVLGLIFEKINGYKEGAFFTPGYITQYMAHQSVRSALVTKFNQVNGWDCADFTELTNQLSRVTKTEVLKRANAIVNGLKILDPAVGSGHFLVSVLNELIAAKSELGLLMDAEGRLLGRYQAVVEADELFLLDQEGEFVTYQAPFRANEAQRVWETIFHEKKALIEGCLFGVDINPNSVQICKLRLWIELLKHAFYTPASGYQELETLPNLDIKIRTGNSLVSRYALEVPLNKIGNGDGGLMSQYLTLVKTYQETPDKKVKAQIEEHIGSIKKQIVADLEESRPLKRRWELARDKLAALTQDELFGLSDKERKERDKKRKPIEAELATLTAQLEDESRNPIFANSFEWRFEFPEVLDPETGAFVGFDVVIGNPPYIRQEELTPYKRHFESRYEVYDGVADISTYFFELSLRMLSRGGKFSFIVSNSFIRANYGRALRRYIVAGGFLESIVDFAGKAVFESAKDSYVCIPFFQKQPLSGQVKVCNGGSYSEADSLDAFIARESTLIPRAHLSESTWLFDNDKVIALMARLTKQFPKLGDFFSDRFFRGVTSGLNEAFTVSPDVARQLVGQDARSQEILYPVISGEDVRKWTCRGPDEYLIFTKRGTDIACYPAIEAHLNRWRSQLTPKLHPTDPVGRKPGRYKWYEIQDDVAYFEIFNRPKILFPELAKGSRFVLDESGVFAKDTVYLIDSGSRALLGILNSRLIWFCISKISMPFGERAGEYRYRLKSQYMEQLPLPPSLFPPVSSSAPSAPPRFTSSPSPEAAQIESLVTRILEAKKTDPAADTLDLEAEIDQLVYRLYGLTDDEIAIVEGR